MRGTRLGYLKFESARIAPSKCLILSFAGGLASLDDFRPGSSGGVEELRVVTTRPIGTQQASPRVGIVTLRVVRVARPEATAPFQSVLLCDRPVQVTLQDLSRGAESSCLVVIQRRSQHACDTVAIDDGRQG